MLSRHALRVWLSSALLAGACTSNSDSPSGPTPIPEPNSTINYTVLGASDAIGFGSSSFCLPFDPCTGGKGYGPVAARDLRARGFTVNVQNLAVPTGVISRRIQDLGAQNGRDILGNFIQNLAPFVGVPFGQTPASLVTIFAGANDVNTITAALGNGAGGTDQIGYINSQIAAFGADYATLLTIIRGRAPAGRLVILNLPNMAGMPFLAGATAPHKSAAQMLSVGMSKNVINPLSAEGVLIVDLMCDARTYQGSTYSTDGFHPSDTGYAWIAAEIVAAATTSYRAPLATCSQMALVP
jgi:lysophospholipase L1-like esterase